MIHIGDGNWIYRNRSRFIQWDIIRIIGVWYSASRFLSQLVGAVVMAEFQNRSASDISNTTWRFRIGRLVIRIVSEASHQGIKYSCLVFGKKVHGSAVRRKTDGFLLIKDSALRWRLSQFATKLSTESMLVVCRPRVVDAGVNDCQRACHHRRTKLRIPHSL